MAAVAVALAVIASPARLLAQDLTPSGERILGDPTDLPLKGQLNAYSGYQFETTDLHVVRGDSQRGAIDTLSQELAYGIVDDLALDLDDRYDWSRAHVTPTTGAGYHRSSSGFADPAFGLTWRALDERRGQPVDLDFTAAYAPNVIRAKTASQTQTGTNAAGDDVLYLEVALAWKTRSLTLQGYVADNRLGRATVYEPSGYLAVQSYWSPTVGLRTELRLIRRLSINVDGSYSFRETVGAFDFAKDVASIRDEGDHASIGVAMNYHIIHNRLVGSLGYLHTFYGPTNDRYPLDPALDVSEQRSGDSLTAGMYYVVW
jgi:hypothetical protein